MYKLLFLDDLFIKYKSLLMSVKILSVFDIFFPNDSIVFVISFISEHQIISFVNKLIPNSFEYLLNNCLLSSSGIFVINIILGFIFLASFIKNFNIKSGI